MAADFPKAGGASELEKAQVLGYKLLTKQLGKGSNLTWGKSGCLPADYTEAAL